MKTKQQCTRFCHRLTGKTLRILLIRAGFPYHKAPHVYQWVWVFLLLPFLEEASMHELIERHGRSSRNCMASYGRVQRHLSAWSP